MKKFLEVFKMTIKIYLSLFLSISIIGILLIALYVSISEDNPDYGRFALISYVFMLFLVNWVIWAKGWIPKAVFVVVILVELLYIIAH